MEEIIEQNNTEVVVKKQNKGDVIRDLLSSYEGKLIPLLDNNKNQYQKLAASFCFTLVEKELTDCTHLSIIKAFKKCCELNLDPSSGMGKIYLIRYGNEVNAQVGYKGYLDLIMRRQDIVSNVYGNIVYIGDEFHQEFGNVVHFRHVPKFKSKELWLTYAVVNFKDGSIQIEVANEKDIEKSKSLSKGVYYYDKKTGLQKPIASSPWNAHYDSMAKVVPMRKIVTNLAISITTEDEFIGPEEVKRVPIQNVQVKTLEDRIICRKTLEELPVVIQPEEVLNSLDPDFYKD